MSTKHESVIPESGAKASAPITFEEFDAIYRARLGDPDQPSCYVAYVRAEAQVEKEYGERRYKNHASYMAARSQRRTRDTGAQESPPIDSKAVNIVTINCQICTTQMFTVPRGDLRTIIPHICEGCKDELRKLIFI